VTAAGARAAGARAACAERVQRLTPGARCKPLCAFLRARREELQQPVFSALDALAYPELHEDSIGVITFTRHLYRLMRTAGVADFSMRARSSTLGPCLRPAGGCRARAAAHV
jgi:hypothetical protein